MLSIFFSFFANKIKVAHKTNFVYNVSRFPFFVVAGIIEANRRASRSPVEEQILCTTLLCIYAYMGTEPTYNTKLLENILAFL